MLISVATFRPVRILFLSMMLSSSLKNSFELNWRWIAFLSKVDMGGYWLKLSTIPGPDYSVCPPPVGCMNHESWAMRLIIRQAKSPGDIKWPGWSKTQAPKHSHNNYCYLNNKEVSSKYEPNEWRTSGASLWLKDGLNMKKSVKRWKKYCFDKI